MTAQIAEEIAKEAFTTGLEILQLIEVMEKQNTGQINGNLSDSGAARAGHVVRNSLISRITLLTAGAYSSTRAGDRHLRAGFDLLQAPALRQQIAFGGRRAAQIASFEATWARLNADPRLATVKHFRDKKTAHSASLKPGVKIPSYNDMFSFAKETAVAMEQYAHAVGVTYELLSESNDDALSSAQAFWEPWETFRAPVR